MIAFLRRAALAALLGLALVLSACGAAPAVSWPGVTLAGDLAYVAFNQNVHALDLAGQREVWIWPLGNNDDLYFGAPAITASNVVVGGYTLGRIYGLKFDLQPAPPAGQQEAWRFEPDPGSVIGDIDLFKRPNGNIVAGLATDGKLVFVGYNNGKLHAIDPAANGAERWVFVTDDEGGFFSQPLVVDGTLYVTTLGHKLYAIDTATGTKRWEYDAGAPIAGEVTVADDLALFGTFDSRVIAVDLASHAPRWTATLDDWIWAAPQVAADVAYAATLRGTVYALSLADGHVLWQRTLPGDPPPAIRAPLLVSDDGLYVAARDGTLYALERDGGAERWRQLIAPDSQLLSQPVRWNDKIVVAVLGPANQPLLAGRQASDGAPWWAYTAPPK